MPLNKVTLSFVMSSPLADSELCLLCLLSPGTYVISSVRITNISNSEVGSNLKAYPSASPRNGTVAILILINDEDENAR